MSGKRVTHFILQGWVVCENFQDGDECAHDMNKANCPDCRKLLAEIGSILERFWEEGT